jgi:hypothetical protein
MSPDSMREIMPDDQEERRTKWLISRLAPMIMLVLRENKTDLQDSFPHRRGP